MSESERTKSQNEWQSTQERLIPMATVKQRYESAASENPTGDTYEEVRRSKIYKIKTDTALPMITFIPFTTARWWCALFAIATNLIILCALQPNWRQ